MRKDLQKYICIFSKIFCIDKKQNVNFDFLELKIVHNNCNMRAYNNTFFSQERLRQFATIQQYLAAVFNWK